MVGAQAPWLSTAGFLQDGGCGRTGSCGDPQWDLAGAMASVGGGALEGARHQQSPGSSQGWAWVPPKRPPQPPPASRTHALGTGYLHGAPAEAPAPGLCRVRSHHGLQVRLISLHLWTRVSPTAQTRPPLPDTHLRAWRQLLASSPSSSGRASLSGCRSPTTTVALRLRSSLCFCSASFMASISKEGETTLEANKRRRRSPGPEPLAHERPGGVPSPAASLLPAVAPIPPREPAGWAGLSYFFFPLMTELCFLITGLTMRWSCSH